MARYEHVRASLGDALYEKVKGARVLMVGAGGIGCELLKNLVMSGFTGAIEIVDLDTIDISNLNRQFLFQRQHVKRPKAVVARETVLQFEPAANVTAYHASIYEPQFDRAYFASFDLVFGALDNIPARRHVNRMCMASGVPLLESGTAGFLGQVTVIKKGLTECFECVPRPAPKTYPVCTIRSTPSLPVHCVVWAKEYLLPQLFGEAEDETANASAEELAESAAEIAELKRESKALRQLRALIGQPDFARQVFTKQYDRDIRRILGMEEMWRNKRRPVPVDLDECLAAAAPTDHGTSTGSALPDQQVWPLAKQTAVFLESVGRLAERYVQGNRAPISFDKDDADLLDFVVAASNLRMHCYGIDKQSRFAIKSIAGNIIPAIATTNAIIAGLLVMQALLVLEGRLDQCSTTYLVRSGRRRMLIKEKLASPRPACFVCSKSSATLRLDLSTATMRFLVETVLKKHLAMQSPVVTEGARLLYDEDFDDESLNASLAERGLVAGTAITVEDETQGHRVEVFLENATTFSGDAQFTLESSALVAQAAPSAAVVPEAHAANGRKRALSDDGAPVSVDDDVVMVVDQPPAPANKRAKTDADDVL